MDKIQNSPRPLSALERVMVKGRIESLLDAVYDNVEALEELILTTLSREGARSETLK